MTFMVKIKLQNYIFLAKYDYFLTANVSLFEPLLGQESAYVCHSLRTEIADHYIGK